MSSLKAYYPVVVVIASSLFASATWAASFQFPHSVHKNACPTAVENVGQNAQTVGQANALTDEGRKAGLGVNNKTQGATKPVAVVQNGLLLPAVKTGKTPGQLAGDAAKTDAAAAAAK